jgi:hypothetical protein
MAAHGAPKPYELAESGERAQRRVTRFDTGPLPFALPRDPTGRPDTLRVAPAEVLDGRLSDVVARALGQHRAELAELAARQVGAELERLAGELVAETLARRNGAQPVRVVHPNGDGEPAATAELKRCSTCRAAAAALRVRARPSLTRRAARPLPRVPAAWRVPKRGGGAAGTTSPRETPPGCAGARERRRRLTGPSTRRKRESGPQRLAPRARAKRRRVAARRRFRDARRARPARRDRRRAPRRLGARRPAGVRVNPTRPPASFSRERNAGHCLLLCCA